MDTYYNIPAGFREQVSDEFNRAVQQEQSMFQDVGMVVPNWIATQHTERITAPLALTETTGQRGGDTPQGEYQVGYRSGFLREGQGVIDFDRKDKDRLYTAHLPDSEAQRDLLSAWGRMKDDFFVDAAQELSYGGVKPYITPASSLPTLMEIPVTWDKISNGINNTNATVWKIAEALQRMATQNVDLDREMVTIAINPKIKQAWLVYAMSAPNSPFAQLFLPWALAKGEPPAFMGCKLIVSNRLRTTGSVTTVLIFAKSAFKVSAPKFDLRVDIRTDKNYMMQIVLFAEWGCFRLYDEKVNLAYADTSVAITY